MKSQRTSDTRPEGYNALPQRFRAHIEALEHEVATLRAAVSTTPMNGAMKVKIVPADREHETYLPDRTMVAFEVGAGGNMRWIEVGLRESARGMGLTVRGDTALAVYPEVSNVINVKLVER